MNKVSSEAEEINQLFHEVKRFEDYINSNSRSNDTQRAIYLGDCQTYSSLIEKMNSLTLPTWMDITKHWMSEPVLSEEEKNEWRE